MSSRPLVVLTDPLLCIRRRLGHRIFAHGRLHRDQIRRHHRHHALGCGSVLSYGPFYYPCGVFLLRRYLQRRYLRAFAPRSDFEILARRVEHRWIVASLPKRLKHHATSFHNIALLRRHHHVYSHSVHSCTSVPWNLSRSYFSCHSPRWVWKGEFICTIR